MRIFSVNCFVLYSCPMAYLFSLICTHTFLAFRCSSELSFLNFPVSYYLWSSGPLVHIWSTYLYFGCYAWCVYFWGCVNWMMKCISYCPFLLFLLQNLFSWVISSTMTTPWVSKICSFYGSYWIILIRLIHFCRNILKYGATEGVLKNRPAGVSIEKSLHSDVQTNIFMDVWTYGRMGVWTYERMNVWTYGRMDVWTYGRMDV